jgi:uncharacterized membrane protein HdeD (DUF308 family)
LSERSPTDTSELFTGRGWVVLLRGLTAVAFGVLAFAWPHMTLARLVLLFGLYALVHGILSIAASIGSRGQRGSLLLAVEGIVGLWAGVMTLGTSTPGPMAFVFLVWLWAIATGILKIAEAMRLRKEVLGDVWLAISGVVTVVLGLVLVSRHFAGVIGLAVLIAAFALIWGVCEILLGWKLGAGHRRAPSGG